MPVPLPTVANPAQALPAGARGGTATEPGGRGLIEVGRGGLQCPAEVVRHEGRLRQEQAGPAVAVGLAPEASGVLRQAAQPAAVAPGALARPDRRHHHAVRSAAGEAAQPHAALTAGQLQTRAQVRAHLRREGHQADLPPPVAVAQQARRARRQGLLLLLRVRAAAVLAAGGMSRQGRPGHAAHPPQRHHLGCRCGACQACASACRCQTSQMRWSPNAEAQRLQVPPAPGAQHVRPPVGHPPG